MKGYMKKKIYSVSLVLQKIYDDHVNTKLKCYEIIAVDKNQAIGVALEKSDKDECTSSYALIISTSMEIKGCIEPVNKNG